VKKVSSIKERIKQFAENTGENKDIFFEKIGVTSANFRGKKLLTGVNADLIEKIVSLYPDVNLEWLITGKERRKEESYLKVAESTPNYAIEKFNSLKVDEKLNAIYKEIKSIKKEVLDNKQEIIDLELNAFTQSLEMQQQKLLKEKREQDLKKRKLS
jgi:hypothetical protein